MFVSVDADGDLRIERGYVRAEDEAPVELVDGGGGDTPTASGPGREIQRAVITIGTGSSKPEAETEEEDGLRPLSDRLITELTAHRTLALRDALASDPGTAFAAVLHTLCLSTFYRMSSGTCLEISAKNASFSAQAPGLADTTSAKAIEIRHQQWAKHLPKNEDDLWDALTAFDGDNQAALFAHCASLSVNAVHEPWNRNSRRLGHADRLARSVNPRHGRRRLDSDRRQLSRPGSESAHPRSGAGGKGRGLGAAHRSSQEARNGQGGRAAAERHQLAA